MVNTDKGTWGGQKSKIPGTNEFNNSCSNCMQFQPFQVLLSKIYFYKHYINPFNRLKDGFEPKS